jgi:steroid delta-isomerase-like uncharacterized protein
MENRELTLRFVKSVFNEKDLSVARELLSDRFVDRTPPRGFGSDKDSHIATFEHFWKAFPDGRMQVHDLISEGDRVVVRYTLRGTHEGRWGPIEPTGETIHLDGVTILRFEGGQITEHWVYSDVLKVLRQLGAFPSLQQDERVEEESSG